MLEKVSVENLELIGKGKCGNVYVLSEDRVIKTFHSFVPKAAVEKEQRNARHMYDMGIPSPNVYDMVTTQEGLGLIYEKVSAPSMESLMRSEPSTFRDYSVQLGKLCRHVHSINAKGVGFISAKEEFLGRLELSRGRICAVSGEEACNVIEQLIRAIPDTNGIVHGDFHPDNVLVKDGNPILIDMADIMTGHPVFDLLSLYFLRVRKIKLQELINSQMECMEDEAVKQKIRTIVERMQSNTFSQEQAKVFWRGFMEGYLDTQDTELIDRITHYIDGYSYIYAAFTERSKGFLGDEIVNISTADGARVLMERKDELLGCFEDKSFSILGRLSEA